MGAMENEEEVINSRGRDLAAAGGRDDSSCRGGSGRETGSSYISVATATTDAFGC